MRIQFDYEHYEKELAGTHFSCLPRVLKSTSGCINTVHQCINAII